MAGGQELAMHDPRLDPGYSLHASVEPTPGRHTTRRPNILRYVPSVDTGQRPAPPGIDFFQSEEIPFQQGNHRFGSRDELL